MKKLVLCISLFSVVYNLSAQKMEQDFDFFFRPTNKSPRYNVITEKQSELWHRQAWYVPEKMLAMEGWYKDVDCTIPHGTHFWYYSNGFLRSKGHYNNGTKDGPFVEFSRDGKLMDSSSYVGGKLIGMRLSWYENGKLRDSSFFDGIGNGVSTVYNSDGSLYCTGYVISDSIPQGQWKYFHTNGKLMATENYVNGKSISGNCFDETGKQLDSFTCANKEGEFPGGIAAWRHFLEENLNPQIATDKGARKGQYTVVVKFIIGKDGKLTNIEPLTHLGYGMEEEVVRILKLSPPWRPAQQHGRKVYAYRQQPITFMVSR
jgi:hypothetical protein